jgi:hypothetical protein
MRAFFLLGVLALSACAAPKPIVWAKPGAAAHEIDRARTECEFQAAAATQQTDSTLRGGLAAEIDRGMRRNNLMALCMRSRGFTRGA